MDCEQIQEKLADYLGQEMEPAERMAFEEHLAGCRRCGDEVGALRDTIRSLRELAPLPQAVPAAPLLASGRGGPAPGTRHYLRRSLAYAAVLLIGVGVGWSARPAAPSQPPPEAGTAPTAQPAPIRERIRSDAFLRNALALSTALSRPAGVERAPDWEAEAGRPHPPQ